MIIDRSLYGLRSSGLRWHEKLADILRDLGFVPSKAEDDIWMRKNGDVYIASYVDDLCIVSKDLKEITDALINKHNYKLKGTGPIKYHLGCDYFGDSDNTLCYDPRKYIEKMIDDYFWMFGCKPKYYTFPLDKGDHPMVDTSKELDKNEVRIYQSLIVSLQWTISLSKMDITTAVISLSGCCSDPRRGHLERTKQIYGYLAKMRYTNNIHHIC